MTTRNADQATARVELTAAEIHEVLSLMDLADLENDDFVSAVNKLAAAAKELDNE